MQQSIVVGRYCLVLRAAIILLRATCASLSNENNGTVLVVYDPIASATGHGGGGHGGGDHGGGHGDYNAGHGRNHGGTYDETNYGGKHGGHRYTSDDYGGHGKKSRKHGVSRHGNRGHTGSNYGYRNHDDRAQSDNGFKNTDGRTAYGQRRGYYDVYHDHGHQSYHKGGRGYYGNDHVKYYDDRSDVGSLYGRHSDDKGNHRSKYYNTKHIKFGDGNGGHGDGGGHGNGGHGYGGGGHGQGGYGGGGHGHGGGGHGQGGYGGGGHDQGGYGHGSRYY